jgi:hypothetical protein
MAVAEMDYSLLTVTRFLTHPEFCPFSLFTLFPRSYIDTKRVTQDPLIITSAVPCVIEMNKAKHTCGIHDFWTIHQTDKEGFEQIRKTEVTTVQFKS